MEKQRKKLSQSINQYTHNQNRLRIEVEEQLQLGVTNWLPLILVIIPNLAPIFFEGEPESWRHSIIFLLIVYFLYKIAKAPWQLYASARTTRIRNQIGLNEVKIICPSKNQSHQECLTELNRIETGFLLLAISSPGIGIGLLVYLQSKLDLGLDYLNSHSTVLYLLASLVKPLGHLYHRLLQRSRYLQSQIEFPAQSAEQFTQTFEDLAFKLNQLELESLTKEELMDFKKHQVDLKLLEISNRLSQFEQSDQLSQSHSSERLSQLEDTLNEMQDKLEKSESSFHHFLLLNHQHPSPLDSISKVFTQVLYPHQHQNINTTRAIDQQPSFNTLDHLSTRSLPSSTPAKQFIKNSQVVEQNLKTTNLSDQLFSNLFKTGPVLETVQHGLGTAGHQIINGIRYPINTVINILSCSLTFFLSFCLILSPIQILGLVTRTKAKNLKGSDHEQVGMPEPMMTSKTLKSIGGDRPRIRPQPPRQPLSHHQTHHSRAPSYNELDQSSSSEPQSPSPASPPASRFFKPAQHHHLHHEKDSDLAHLQSAGPNSVYNLQHPL